MTYPVALVVEDDSKLVKIFEHTLRSVDFEVKTVMDGQAALDLLAHITPDLILLDMHLPKVSGDKVLHFIRHNHRLKDVHVIVASADGVMADNLMDNPDMVLLKPVSIMQLQRMANRFRPTPV